MDARKRTGSRTAFWAVIGVVGVVLLGALVATAITTDRSSFCNNCHEMVPYYDAWTDGTHSQAGCIECHVEPGIVQRLAHKWVALGEVVAHVQGDTSFPRPEAPEVPDERCRRCHENPGPTNPAAGFSHDLHEGKAPCQRCHPSVGHEVTAEALQAAGIYNAEAAKAREAKITSDTPAAIGAGVANIPGHRPVGCSRCHDMKATGCAACHKRPKGHIERTDCLTCHKTTGGFAFVHPTSTDCASCHKRPTKNHPERNDCVTCHRAGASWAFVHPASNKCTECHKRPTQNHTKRNDCATCHRPGKSWVFVHPASRDCGACHNRPASHYGGACSRCHRVSVPFSQTRFNHPPAPHSPRSIPCARCHPSGGSRVSCTCHGGGTSGGD